MKLGLSPEEAVAALKGSTPSGMRQKVVDHHGVTVVEDCYNASPDSMAAALDTVRSFPVTGRRIFVMSDMLELGEIALRSHREVGEKAAASGVDLLLAWGELSREAVLGAQAAGMAEARFFPEKEDLTRELAALVRAGDLVWFKASRGMKLEEVIQGLYQLI